MNDDWKDYEVAALKRAYDLPVPHATIADFMAYNVLLIDATGRKRGMWWPDAGVPEIRVPVPAPLHVGATIDDIPSQPNLRVAVFVRSSRVDGVFVYRQVMP